jgi:hypothetical protein
MTGPVLTRAIPNPQSLLAQAHDLQGLMPNTKVAQVVDLRNLNPKTKVGPGETVLTKPQFQELNKTLDLSGVPRKEGARGPAFQFEGWPGAKGGLGASSPLYPNGAKGWEFTTQKPISMGGNLSIPAGSTISSGPTGRYPLEVTIPGSSGGKSGSSLIEFEAGTIRGIRDQMDYDTGIRSTKIIVHNGDGKRAQVEVRGTLFLDQKNGEMKIVRGGAKGEYVVQTLQNALKEHFKDYPIDGREFADALRNAGALR